MPKRPDRSASSYLYRRLPRIPSFLHPILIESDGKDFFVRGKLRRENRVSFIARRSFVYSYCWYRVDFTGIFMVDGCCVARWHLGKAKGKCQK